MHFNVKSNIQDMDLLGALDTQYYELSPLSPLLNPLLLLLSAVGVVSLDLSACQRFLLLASSGKQFLFHMESYHVLSCNATYLYMCVSCC